jgi:hypothetical protein
MQKELEDTKGVIRVRKSKKDRQHIRQKKKDKRTNNDIHGTMQKAKDRVTRTPLQTGDERRCFRWANSSCFTSDTPSCCKC